MEVQSPPLIIDSRIKIPLITISNLLCNGWILDEDISKQESPTLEWVVFVQKTTTKRAVSRIPKIRMCNILVNFGECCAKQFENGRRDIVRDHIKSHVKKIIQPTKSIMGK